MAPTLPHSESLLLASLALGVISIYSYALYLVPSIPRAPTTELLSREGIVPLLRWLARPITYLTSSLLLHIHVPFLPLAYFLSVVYSILYPLVLVLHALLYAVWAPIAMMLALGKLLYPLYVFFGVAALIGVGIGGGCAGVVRVVWLVIGAD